MHFFGAVTGALAALAGPRHCGETMLVTALFHEAREAGDVDRYVAARLARTDTVQRTILPGFGHMLYPSGDPRATILLEMLAEQAATRAERQTLIHIDSIVRAAYDATGLAPTVDFALSALERVLALPQGAAFSLFALGRAAGWLAHAMEQIEDGRLIRPRARYVGPDEPVR
jgi:citrate synthase